MQKENNNNIGSLSTHQACASCKHQRKKCSEDCVLAPLFPSEKALDFQAVHKLFGVSNVSKLLKSIPRDDDRKRAADSLVWEANCRKKDLVQGPYGEYKRVLEELKFYKSMHRGMVLNGWGNHINGPSKGSLCPNGNIIGPITNVSANNNNYNIGIINDGMIESNRVYNNSPMRVHVSDQMHSSNNGYNVSQQYYLTGQYNSNINGKTTDGI